MVQSILDFWKNGIRNNGLRTYVFRPIGFRTNERRANGLRINEVQTNGLRANGKNSIRMTSCSMLEN